MEANAVEVRARVGQLAADVSAGNLSQEKALELLRNEARARKAGVVGRAQEDVSVVHACPWHTCQGTLHAPAD